MAFLVKVGANDGGGNKRIPARIDSDTLTDSGTAGTTLTSARVRPACYSHKCGRFCDLAECDGGRCGASVCYFNATTSDNAGAIRGDGSDKFYDNDTTAGETANQQVDKMKAKTVVCFAADSWAVIG